MSMRLKLSLLSDKCSVHESHATALCVPSPELQSLTQVRSSVCNPPHPGRQLGQSPEPVCPPWSACQPTGNEDSPTSQCELPERAMICYMGQSRAGTAKCSTRPSHLSPTVGSSRGSSAGGLKATSWHVLHGEGAGGS